MILNKNNTFFTRIYPQILRKRLKRKATNDVKIPLLRQYLETHHEEDFAFLPEDFAALFDEQDAVVYLQSKRRERELNAQPAAAPVTAFVPPPFVAFVPPVAAPEPPPPAYADVMRMKAEEAKLTAELLEKTAAAEQAAAQSVGVYPVAPPMNASYPAELQNVLEAGAKLREQAEALPAQAVPVAIPVPVEAPAPAAVVEVKPEPTVSKTEDPIAGAFATLFSTSKASEPVMTDDLLSQPVISSVKDKPKAIDMALEESTLPADFLKIDLLIFPEEAAKPTPSAIDELIAAQKPTVIAPAKYRNPFDDVAEGQTAPVAVVAAPAVEKKPFNPFEIPDDVSETDLNGELDNDDQYPVMDDAAIRKLFGLPAASPNNPFIDEQAQIAEAQRVFDALPSLPDNLKAPAAIFFPPKPAEQAPEKKPVAQQKKQEQVPVLAGK